MDWPQSVGPRNTLPLPSLSWLPQPKSGYRDVHDFPWRKALNSWTLTGFSCAITLPKEEILFMILLFLLRFRFDSATI